MRRFQGQYCSSQVRAVLCGLLGLLAATSVHALEPYQQEALDAILANVEGASRPMVRAQFEPMLATMSPAQVQMMLDGIAAAEAEDAGDDSGADSGAGDDGSDERSEAVASPEDLAYNRAQYEPVIRALWDAQKDFDTFVTDGIAKDCGEPGAFAVFGHGWQYELWPMSPTWTRASDSPDLDVEILGTSYAAQDGRYRYDFSAVRTSFDRQAVGSAVSAACAEYTVLGQAFVADARARVVDDMLPAGEALEGTVNAQAAPIRQRLEAELEAQAPAANGALFQALLNGERVTASGL